MQRIKNLTQDKFIKNNIVFFFGSMVVAFLNYLYHPILGRMMEVEDFGEVQAFISFFLIFAVFSGIFKNVITNLVANYKSDEDKKTILMLQRAGIYFAIFISIILILFGGYFTSFFNFSSHYFFMALALLIVLGVTFATNQAVIQGLHDFKALSVSGIIYSGCRVVFSVILVYFGLAIFGAIGGMILAQLVAVIYVFVYSNKKFKLGTSLTVKIDGRIKKEIFYAILVFAATLSYTFLYSADTIIVKKFFSAEIAGFYSGMATIGRIIIFITGSVSVVLLPAIKIKDEENKNKKILLKSIILALLIGGGALLTFLLFPTMITRLLIGTRYIEYSYLLPKIGLFLFIVSLSNLLFFYLLALRKKFVFVASIIGPALVLALSATRHNSLEDIIMNFLIGSIATLIVLSIKIIFEFFKHNEYEKTNINNNPGS